MRTRAVVAAEVTRWLTLDFAFCILILKWRQPCGHLPRQLCSRRVSTGSLRFDQHLAENFARSQFFERFSRPVERKNGIDDWLQFALCGPLQRRFQVGTVSAIAADEPLLFDEQRPDVKPHVAAGGRAAGDDRAAAGQTFEAAHQHFAANMFENEIDAAALSDFANLA